MVQQLRLCASNAGAEGLGGVQVQSLVGELRSHNAVGHGQKNLNNFLKE